MRPSLLPSVGLSAILLVATFGGSSSSQTSTGTETANGCKLSAPPMGADKTTIKSWVDPRLCKWSEKYSLFAPPPPGDGSLQKAQNAGKIRICAEYDQPPGVYSDPKTSKIVGYEPDILQELTKRLGIKTFEYVSTQFASYIPALQAHQCDVVMGVIAITSKRAQAPGIRYTSPYLLSSDKIIVLKDSPYQKIADFKGQKIAAVPGSIEQIKTKQMVANLGGGTQMVEFPTAALCFTALLNRQVAAYMDVSLALLQRPDADKLRLLDEDPPNLEPDTLSPYRQFVLAAITASSDNDLNIAFSIGLTEMKTDGTLERIFTANKSYLPGVLDLVRPDA
jgi:polar amino acid transport system substrate-binding protein